VETTVFGPNSNLGKDDPSNCAKKMVKIGAEYDYKGKGSKYRYYSNNDTQIVEPVY